MRSLFPFGLATLLAGCSSAQSNAPSSPSPFVATAVGRIDSEGEARQLVAAADGVIEQIFVERGSIVKRGQTLLRVDCGPRLAQVQANLALGAKASAAAHTVEQGARAQEIDAAAAEVDAAESALREQEQRLATAEALVERGFISKRELAARTNARDSARAELRARTEQRSLIAEGARASEIAEANAAARAAHAGITVARAMADQCTLESPIAGQVLQILRREGEFSGASQGLPLIIVGDVSRPIVRAELNERDAASVREGQRAIVWIDGKRERWTGRVTQMANVMGRRSARSLDPTDRFDRDIREVFISFDTAQPPALVGLRVTVGLLK